MSEIFLSLNHTLRHAFFYLKMVYNWGSRILFLDWDERERVAVVKKKKKEITVNPTSITCSEIFLKT